MAEELAIDLAPELRIPVLASMARRHREELRELVERIGDSLERALPYHVVVQRKGLWKRGRVERITVILDDTHYELHSDSNGVHTTIRGVRGGMLRRVRHHDALDWVTRLVAHIDACNQRSEVQCAAFAQLAARF